MQVPVFGLTKAQCECGDEVGQKVMMRLKDGSFYALNLCSHLYIYQKQ